ncbi:MAG TPA: ribosome maturation factor RimM [Acidimicrobiia bacterium]
MAPAAGELEVGRIGHAHGVRGEVSLTLVSNRPERTRPGAVLRAGDRELVVASARRHHDRWLVRFEGIDDRDGAEALRGAVLTASPLGGDVELADGEYWVHELIGSAVVDTGGGALGAVAAIEANPAHDLLVLDSGALVPIVFVVERRDGTVVVDPPDGLLDL